MMTPEHIYAIALTRIPRLSLRNAKLLYQLLGSATVIGEQRNHLADAVPGVADSLVAAIRNGWDNAVALAEIEASFIEKHSIDCLCPSDPNYPTRLHSCDDAPLVLFYRGSCSLNAPKVVSVVGTRNITEYGKDLCRTLTRDLALLCPEVLVVSGLAYGVDIYAHRGAMDAKVDTVGVLAHGLDRIYPASHRSAAQQMLTQGGILTEFMSGTIPDKGNFVRRNRIVAGMCDACVVVESAPKGGALITAGIAQDYNRDVFAFPGRINDPYSEGCNRLIRDNGAQLITSAADISSAMGWLTASEQSTIRQKNLQRELFPNLSQEERRVVDLLTGTDGKQINQLVVEANIPVQRITVLLFEMELRGIVKAMSGGKYRILM